jgi:hypothetical protein
MRPCFTRVRWSALCFCVAQLAATLPYLAQSGTEWCNDPVNGPSRCARSPGADPRPPKPPRTPTATERAMLSMRGYMHTTNVTGKLLSHLFNKQCG